LIRIPHGPVLAAGATALVLVAQSAQPAETAAPGQVQPPPRTQVFRPPPQQDINGVWWTRSYSPRIVPIAGGELPFTPAGKAAYDKNIAGLKARTVVDVARYLCVPDGVPRIWLSPYPFQIFQTAGQTTILYETNHAIRIVKHDTVLNEDLVSALPYFSGHSTGRWNGDTLEIETTGYKDITFLDDTGVPHSDQMKTRERIRKIDGGRQLEVQVEVTDPATFTMPWTARFVFEARPDIRIETQVCGEKHRDLKEVRGAPQ
jgi:hypothetical protein